MARKHISRFLQNISIGTSDVYRYYFHRFKIFNEIFSEYVYLSNAYLLTKLSKTFKTLLKKESVLQSFKKLLFDSDKFSSANKRVDNEEEYGIYFNNVMIELKLYLLTT